MSGFSGDSPYLCGHIVTNNRNREDMSELRKLKVTEMNRLTVEEFKQAQKLPLVVVLDGVRSLHNIGAVFRTADAFLVNSICLCGITATPPHPELHKTAPVHRLFGGLALLPAHVGSR